MTIAILGATGRTGRPTIDVAIQRGHTVTAVVRGDPGRLEITPPSRVAVADTTDVEALAAALQGTTAVLSCIGPVAGESTTVQQHSMAATLQAMARTDTRRLVALSASGGFVDGDDPLARYLAKPVLARVLRDSNADMAEMERLMRASETDWTILRPPRLTAGESRGRYRSRRDGNVRWHYSMRRSHLALAVVDALEDDSSIGQTIGLSD